MLRDVQAAATRNRRVRDDKGYAVAQGSRGSFNGVPSASWIFEIGTGPSW